MTAQDASVKISSLCEDIKGICGYYGHEAEVIRLANEIISIMSKSQQEQIKQLNSQNASLKNTLYRVKPEARCIYE